MGIPSALAKFLFSSCGLYGHQNQAMTTPNRLPDLQSALPHSIRCSEDYGTSINYQVQQEPDVVGRDLLSTSVSSLQNATEFSIDAWLTVSKYQRFQPIVTISSNDPESEGCLGYSFQIAQFYGNFLLSYTDRNPFRKTSVECRFLYIKRPESTEELTHLAVTFQDAKTNVYKNGERLFWDAPNFLDDQFGVWDFHRLELMGTEFLEPAHVYWGSLYQVDVWDEGLSSLDVQHLYENGVQKRIGAPPPLVATAQSPLVVLNEEDEQVELILGTRNHTMWDVSVQIVTLPQYGQLWYQGRQLDVDDIISTGDSSSTWVSLQYTASDRTEYDLIDSFEFRAVARNGNNETGASDTEHQRVKITGHPPQPSLLVPETATIAQVNTSRVVLLGIRYNNWRPDATVKVNLEANAGTVSLPNEYSYLANIRCQYDAWQCQGTGNQDKTMVFQARAGNVPALLHRLVYVRTAPREGSVRIQVSDCSKSDDTLVCDDPIESTIHIPLTPEEDPKDTSSLPKPLLLRYANALFWILVGICSVCCYCSVQSCLRCFVRGGVIDVDDDEVSINYGN